jgi:hypothetical protein
MKVTTLHQKLDERNLDDVDGTHEMLIQHLLEAEGAIQI